MLLPSPQHWRHVTCVCACGGDAVLTGPESSCWGVQRLPKGKGHTHFWRIDFQMHVLSPSGAAGECTWARASGLACHSCPPTCCAAHRAPPLSDMEGSHSRVLSRSGPHGTDAGIENGGPQHWGTRPCGSEGSRALFPIELQDNLIELSTGTSLKSVFGGKSLCSFGGYVIQKESKGLGDIAVTKLPSPSACSHDEVSLHLCLQNPTDRNGLGAEHSFIPAINTAHRGYMTGLVRSMKICGSSNVLHSYVY